MAVRPLMTFWVPLLLLLQLSAGLGMEEATAEDGKRPNAQPDTLKQSSTYVRVGGG